MHGPYTTSSMRFNGNAPVRVVHPRPLHNIIDAVQRQRTHAGRACTAPTQHHRCGSTATHPCGPCIHGPYTTSSMRFNGNAPVRGVHPRPLHNIIDAVQRQRTHAGRASTAPTQHHRCGRGRRTQYDHAVGVSRSSTICAASRTHGTQIVSRRLFCACAARPSSVLRSTFSRSRHVVAPCSPTKRF